MSSQHEIEIILLRRWASYLNLATFLVASDGRLLYYNDAAAAVLGRSFDAAGQMTVDDLPRLFQARAADGTPVAVADLPLHRALSTRRPDHRQLQITGLDGAPRTIEIVAVPLEGQGGRHLGALAIFWQADPA